MHHFRTYLRLYQGAVLMALLIFTFRLYVSPSGAPDIHSWFREPAEQFFRRIGFDELMWNFNIALAGLGILNILVGALLIKRISAKAYFDGCIFSLLAFTLPLSHFGYAMAHSDGSSFCQSPYFGFK